MSAGSASSPRWSSEFMFLAAAIGSAVGISNIWKFSYVAGANGGGAFVIVYLAATLLVALPVVLAEFLIGRRGREGIEGSMVALSRNDGISPYWRFYAFIALLGIFLALSFYCVVAGWTVDYFFNTVTGQVQADNGTKATETLNALLQNPMRMMLWSGIFVGLTALTVAGGIKSGLERVLRLLTPGLFIILIALLGYAVIYGDFSAALEFMFVPDFSKLTAEVTLMAFGQAFFSMGAGVGVLLTIGCYMDQSDSLVRGATIVALSDAGVAIIAGLAIFPIVFAYSLSPGEGPGLIFATLPIAFAQMPGGQIVGSVFFLLLALAAFTSAVTILETIVAWLERRFSASRPLLSLCSGIALWLFGLVTVFSFNIWSDVRLITFVPALAEKNVFELLDYLVSNIIMPVGGICIALIAGWALSRKSTLEELGIQDGLLFKSWRFSVRYLVPGAVAAVFFVNLT